MEYTHVLGDIPTLANGASPRGEWENLDAVWVAVRPYLRTRANDIHLPLSFNFAELLLDHQSWLLSILRNTFRLIQAYSVKVLIIY